MSSERTQLLLAMGMFENSRGKLSRGYTLVTDAQYAEGDLPDDSELRGSVMLFEDDKPMRTYLGGRAGTVYRIAMPDDKTIKPGTAEVVGQWPQSERRVTWQARSTSVERAHRARRDRAKLEKDDALKAALDPVREAMRSARGQHRTQLLAAVVDYITR